jgi:hypothetical protein
MAKKITLEPQEEVMTDMNTKYVYCLVRKNEQTGKVFDEAGRVRTEPDYPPNRNLLIRSSIIWDGSPDPFTIDEKTGEGKKRAKGRHMIRYYDGCTTLFVDDQPKDKETIDNHMSNTRQLRFLNGLLPVYGYDMMLKAYMDMASWNGESKYRVSTVEVIYKLLNTEKEMQLEDDILDEVEEAMQNAKEASDKHMLIHAKFLGIPEIDYKSGNPLTIRSIRTLYRKEAKNHPKNFNRTFNDKTIHIKSWIEKALEVGEISTTLIPNKAVWGKKGSEICDISGLKSAEGILNKLIEFSQSADGEEFVIQLKALYN